MWLELYAFKTRDNMKMQMINRLACGRFIELNDRHTIGVERLLDRVGDRLHGLNGFSQRFRLRIQQIT